MPPGREASDDAFLVICVILQIEINLHLIPNLRPQHTHCNCVVIALTFFRLSGFFLTLLTGQTLGGHVATCGRDLRGWRGVGDGHSAGLVTPVVYYCLPTLCLGKSLAADKNRCSRCLKRKIKEPDFNFFFQEEEQEHIIVSLSHRLANRSYLTFTALRHKNALPSLLSIMGQTEKRSLEAMKPFPVLVLFLRRLPTASHPDASRHCHRCCGVMSQLLIFLLPQRTHHMFAS